MPENNTSGIKKTSATQINTKIPTAIKENIQGTGFSSLKPIISDWEAAELGLLPAVKLLKVYIVYQEAKIRTKAKTNMFCRK